MRGLAPLAGKDFACLANADQDVAHLFIAQRFQRVVILSGKLLGCRERGVNEAAAASLQLSHIMLWISQLPQFSRPYVQLASPPVTATFDAQERDRGLVAPACL